MFLSPCSLEHIRGQLETYNISDIKFYIVNSNQQHAIDNVGELARRVTFPVYQDTTRSNIWQRLGGGKDDVFIYDKCGQLTHHIPYPRSMLYKPEFQNSLWETYYQNPCNCDPSQPIARSQSQGSAGTQTGSDNTRDGDVHSRDHGGARGRQHGGHHSHHGHGHRRRTRRHQTDSADSMPDVIKAQVGEAAEQAMMEQHKTGHYPSMKNSHNKCRHGDTLCKVLKSSRRFLRRQHKHGKDS